APAATKANASAAMPCIPPLIDNMATPLIQYKSAGRTGNPSDAIPGKAIFIP
ncbi:MAG: hypothetical protein H6R21_3303, partial [Proteobacteria bacterium]|nr:hypothetical protein [Pseudomonadota bacterium]